MSRDLSSANAAALAARVVRVAIFAELELPLTPLRVWTGRGEYSTLGRLFSGVGQLGRIAPPSETVQLTAGLMTVQLSGVPTELIGSALTENFRNRRLRLWWGFFNDTFTATVDDPHRFFTGRMNPPEIQEEAGSCTIAISAESVFAELRRVRGGRWTHEDQQRRHPGDRGFEYIARLSERLIPWGVPSANSGGAYG